MQAATQQFREAYPGIIGPKDVFSVQRLRDTMVQDVRGSLLVLQGAVSCVLLIACVNVAGLLLVRSTARVREIAIKAALGAGRGRIVRQLVTESVVLSVIGGVLGLSLGILGMQALLAMYPDRLAWVGEIGLQSIDGTVLGFTMVTAGDWDDRWAVPCLARGGIRSQHGAESQHTDRRAAAPARGALDRYWSRRRSRSPWCCSSARRCWDRPFWRCARSIPDSILAAC